MGELSRSIFISPEAAQKYYAVGQDVGVPYGGYWPEQKFKEPAYQRQVASIEEWLLIAYKEGVLINDDWVVQQRPDRAVLVYWDMMDEAPAVFAATETLVGGVAKVPLKIKSRDTSGEAQELADFIKFAFERIDVVTMLQEIAHGEFTGYSVFELVYEEARWRGRKVLVPSHGVRINESKIVFDYFNRPKLITLHNPIVGAFFAPSGKYVVYKRGSRPYGDALLKHAFQPYWYKRNGMMALAQYIERFGVPPVFAAHTGAVEMEQNLVALKALRSQSIGSFPRGLAGTNPLFTLEPNGTSSAVMDRSLQFFNDEIFRAILGGTRQMSDSDEAGAYSATEVHADQVADRQENILRRLKFVVNDQIIPGVVRLNFGIQMRKIGNTYVQSDFALPHASFENDDQETPNDYMNRVTSWREMGNDALPISKKQFHLRSRLEPPVDSDDALLPSAQQLPGGNLPTKMNEMADTKQVIVSVLREFFNENHDEIGRFTFGTGDGKDKGSGGGEKKTDGGKDSTKKYIVASPEQFSNHFNEAFAGAARSGYVNHYSLDEIRNEKMTPLLSNDGKTGLLIHDHGDGRIEATALFNTNGRGEGVQLLRSSIVDHGVNYVECFGPKLPVLYGKVGFRESERYSFDKEQAPKNWNSEEDDSPDYVIMNLK